MCAIAGMVGSRLEDASVRAMLETMRRRGPDGSGVYREPEVNLLHTRLAVIDPEGGSQPMELSWGQETYVLIYNGELYNAEELRRELILRGHSFQTHCDTEVLLHAYAQYGEDCVEKLNGIYAFAVWEKREKRLFLARDRIGVKPLFYARCRDTLLFASEMKTLFAAGLEPRLDRQGAAQLLLLGPGRLPGSGVFQGIRELEPGCCGYYAEGRFRWRRYWYLKDRIHTETFDETVECVRYLVEDAIRRQTVSDVPLGTFLSGGLDSSIITAFCAEAAEKAGARLSTFSVDYLNNSRYFTANKFQPNSDGEYIQLMADRFRTDHHETMLDVDTLTAALETATEARDLPGMADVDFSLLAFCREIRPHVKVALSGECADEIFGGYPWYRDPEIRSSEGFPWSQNVAERRSLLTENAGQGAEDLVMDAYRKVMEESDVLPEQQEEEIRMKQMVNLNFRYFMQTLLDRKDRMSMYHSLEVRVPFCDHRIAEYLYGVPWHFKDYKGQEKGLLRRAVQDLLPEKILYRKKSPFPKTYDPGYTAYMMNRLQDLAETDSPLWYMVRKEVLTDLIRKESPWPWYGQLMRRPQTAAYFLQMDHWLKYYRVEFTF